MNLEQALQRILEMETENATERKQCPSCQQQALSTKSLTLDTYLLNLHNPNPKLP